MVTVAMRQAEVLTAAARSIDAAQQVLNILVWDIPMRWAASSPCRRSKGSISTLTIRLQKSSKKGPSSLGGHQTWHGKRISSIIWHSSQWILGIDWLAWRAPKGVPRCFPALSKLFRIGWHMICQRFWWKLTVRISSSGLPVLPARRTIASSWLFNCMKSASPSREGKCWTLEEPPKES